MKYILLIFLLLPFAFANDMTILSVAETDNGTRFGATASLEIEINPGQGRVFIDTYPLSQIDTQVSTRIAKQIGCDIAQVDCSTLDFVYTINSGSSIIGGPSAGAPMTVLTAVTLLDLPYDRKVTLTGTINSGGFIGPVGGIKEKIEAAASLNMNTILIPQGTRMYNESNVTLDLVTYGESVGVRVVEISNVYDALYYFTGTPYEFDTEFDIPEFYGVTMKNLALDLCGRADTTISSLAVGGNLSENTSYFVYTNQFLSNDSGPFRLPNSSIDVNATVALLNTQINQSKIAFENEQYYSAASFCYGAGLNARFISFIDKNRTQIEEFVNESLEQYEPFLTDYSTMTELQTFMLVEERISEAKRLYDLARNTSGYAGRNLYASAVERMYSAYSWSQFYQEGGQEYIFNENVLRESCLIKIREAEDRQNFLDSWIPIAQNGAQDLESAREYYSDGSYALCLHDASRAKASIDVILGIAGVEIDQYEQILTERFELVESIVAKQAQKGIFPIIGYSYLEYAKSLGDSDPASSLLYLQYSVELSNLDVYFTAKNNGSYSPQNRELSPMVLVLLGLILGLIIGFIVGRIS